MAFEEEVHACKERSGYLSGRLCKRPRLTLSGSFFGGLADNPGVRDLGCDAGPALARRRAPIRLRFRIVANTILRRADASVIDWAVARRARLNNGDERNQGRDPIISPLIPGSRMCRMSRKPASPSQAAYSASL
jgi:hypothetical protein